jgi:hypothetical protein
MTCLRSTVRTWSRTASMTELKQRLRMRRNRPSAGRTIWWTGMNGQNPAGAPLSGFTGGTFTTTPGGQLTLTNAIWSGGMFVFDVTSQAGQTLTVEYSSTPRPNQWQTLLTSNSPASRVHIADPHSSTNRYLFYRARTGS